MPITNSRLSVVGFLMDIPLEDDNLISLRFGNGWRDQIARHIKDYSHFGPQAKVINVEMIVSIPDNKHKAYHPNSNDNGRRFIYN